MKSRLIISIILFWLLFSLQPIPQASAAGFCDAANFVMDVTIPDGTSFSAGTPFVKTWRLRNAGTCTWSKAYALVFAGGEQMGAPAEMYLPVDVLPGQVVDLSVQMTAPSAAGKYRGNWMFRNASGVLFGIGANANSPFWVEINVSAPLMPVFDFTANVCGAQWYYDGGPIPCPKKEGKEQYGYVVRLDNPLLENGTAAGAPALLTIPQQKYNGVIKGVYPPFTIQRGDRFQAIIGCEYGATSCYVNFILEAKYAGGGGTVWKFTEKYDGRFYRADVDLNPLVGKKNVQLILTVSAAGIATGDRPLWVAPSIMRPFSVAIPPTPTLPPTGVPTLTPTPPAVTPTATLPPASSCDRAEFVADVTIPDGSIINGGQTFTKTWRLKNVGTCAWTPSYSLAFVGGNQMGAPASISLSNNIVPGQTADISINLTAPAAPGTYQGYWMLRNATGGFFGIGSAANKPFWVEIVVPQGAASNGYDFVANVCSATWMSGMGVLPCNGTDGDSRGFVIKKDTTVLEDGTPDARPGLLTVPQNINYGWIQGVYPPYIVQAGDRFQSIVNCEPQAATCNVFFRLDYQIGTEPVQTLAAYNEAYDGRYYTANLDLTSLAGKQVKFILTVLANGPAAGDRAVWISPRIVPAAPLAPQSATATATPVPPTATPLPTPAASTTGWMSYQNPSYKFTFNVPAESVFVSAGSTQARINLPFTPGTNLSEKYLEVLVNEGLTPCLDSNMPTPSTSQSLTFNGIQFLQQTGQEGAAGQIYDWVSYSTSKETACITLRFVLHSANPGAFSTPPPLFDMAAETAVFTQIMNTFGWMP